MEQPGKIQEKTHKTLRQFVAGLLETQSGKLASKLVQLSIIVVIGIAVLSIILESVPSYHRDYSEVFLSVAIFTTSFFAMEYLLRVWTAPDLEQYKNLNPFKARLKYICSPEAIIDLIAFLPVILTFNHVDLRILRIIRLFSILKLTRYNRSMNVLVTVVKNQHHIILATFFILLIMLIITSTGIYLIERDHQPDAFGSIPKAMWWGIVTITTIGYGDVIPITPLGKFFASVIVFIGIGIIALPTGILASAFSAQMNHSKMFYMEEVRKALANGDISFSELKELKEIQNELNLSDDEARLILKEQLEHAKESRKNITQSDENGNVEVIHSHHRIKRYCPHCGEDLYS